MKFLLKKSSEISIFSCSEVPKQIFYRTLVLPYESADPSDQMNFGIFKL